MTLNRADPTPLYQQIKAILDRGISSGQLAPGQSLPSEKDLQQRFGVSRITVRQAVSELALEEKVVRVPGKGTFVLHPKVEPLTALTSFSENMRAQGLTPSYREAKMRLVEPPVKVRQALDLDANAKALRLLRLMLADGQPMAIQEEYLPGWIYEGHAQLLTPQVLNTTSLYQLLEKELHIPIVQAEEFVEASRATPEEAKGLGIQAGDLVLLITRITCTDSGRPIEFVKLVFRADRYRYRVQLFRPR